MTKLSEMRLKLLLQQEHQRISESQNDDVELSVVQARLLCWAVLLAEAHEDQADHAEKRGDTEQAMGWFADSQRLRDVINLVTSIEIPYLEENNHVDSEKDNTSASLSLQDQKNSVIFDTNENITQNETPDFFKNLKTLLESLDGHCIKISNLLAIHDQRLADQDQIDKQLFEKIKMLESLKVPSNGSIFQKGCNSQKTQYKPYKDKNKEFSQWAYNTSRVFEKRRKN